ncbi:hypothetical protein [Hymenobacter jeollabukensis]|uniref:T9SS type A sorting domain-containing protein n=1 Tax=Hymenobacter jeollabukensis TaxID=2025313 RepID=A0A5R8WUF6_9BACT|nr:hypothetical protein [Hymenobacter jeollabukensis]TLM95402.1 hypothetical protein FDY95_06325 [Hymenobacter jeollabukensis]
MKKLLRNPLRTIHARMLPGWRPAALAALLLLLHFASWAANPSAGPVATAAPSLAQVLNPDGTLKPGTTGSFDARQFVLSTAPDGRPVFRPAGVRSTHGPGDDKWLNGFTLPGVNAQVRALAVSGPDVYVGGFFTTAGDKAVSYVAKWNGSSWSRLGTTGPNGLVHALAVSGSTLYAGGEFNQADGVAAPGVARWNGSSWSGLGTGITGVVYALAASGSDLYVGGGFTQAGGAPASNVARWNGSAWSSLATGVNGVVYALAVSGSDLYMGGRFTQVGAVSARGLARWNGSSWSGVGGGVNGWVNALAVSGSDLYVGGRFTQAGNVLANNVGIWNGGNWLMMGSSSGTNGVSDEVFALTVNGNDVYVGGSFLGAGGTPAVGVAKWDGDWSTLGPGLSIESARTVRALTSTGGEVYAGGDFAIEAQPTPSGATAALNVGKWNGSRWNGLGTGLDGPVRAVAVSGNDVYVAGSFTQAGSVAAAHVARWNGSSWSSLGAGVNGVVNALAVSGPDLYVGGDFTQAGGLAANYVARWNGSSWSSPGAGVNGVVFALAVSGSDLYAGGFFSEAGGVPASNVARWNGSSWSSLGTGVTNIVPGNGVFALAASGSDLYMGGNFNRVGGVAANNVARWNGTAWSSLGTGISTGSTAGGGVGALLVSGGTLYVGGRFVAAGGVPAQNLARWNGAAWSSLPTGGAGSAAVTGLAVSGPNLYVVGADSQSPTTPTSTIARWDGSSWTSLGTGLNGAVEAVAVGTGGQVYAGGGFVAVGDGSKVTAHFGVYDPAALPTAARPRASAPNLAIYPNPARAEVRVRVPAAATAVVVTDLAGRTLRTIPLRPGQAEARLSLRGLAPGAYWLRAGAAAGKLLVE